MPRTRRRLGARAGATLLEVLVALVLVATMAASVAELASTNANLVARARDADAEMRRASAFLDVVALWPREDLDRHFGDHEQGQWRLRVQRVAPELYTLALTDSAGRRVLLTTAVYRADSTASADANAAH